MGSIEDKNLDVCCICESWLFSQNSPTTAIIKSHGYAIEHDYRDHKRGGGTAIIYKACYLVNKMTLPTCFSTFEVTCVTVVSQTSKKVVFVALYRTGSLTNLFFQELDCLLSHICSHADNVIITGDFNIHFENISDKHVKNCLDLMASYGFLKHISEPTHINGGTLDQLFTFSLDKQLSLTSEVDSMHKFGSDHFPIYCKINLSFDKKYFKQVTYRKLSGINQSELNYDLTQACSATFIDNGEFGRLYEALRSSLGMVMDKHAPVLTKNISVMDEAPWFDKEYRQLRSRRRYAEKCWKKKNDPSQYLIYKELCDEASILANSKKKAFFSKLIRKSDNNSKTLFNLVNNALDRKQQQPLPDSTESIGSQVKEFNDYFSDKIKKIRADMDHEFSPPLNEFVGKNLSEFIPTSYDEIMSIIKETSVKTSPDDILPTRTFIEHLEILAPFIVQLVNLSLKNGSMDSLKSADIMPLLKGTSLDHNLLKNFRPVSNLQFIGKIIERVVLRRLNVYMTANNLEIPEQSAYKKHFSTETLLVRLTNDILIASDAKNATVVLLLDLSAAFDTVEHSILLRILKNEIGLCGTVLKWFRSFLTTRTQRTRLGSTVSEEIIILFGVPQGSVLGPVLFNIYIRSIYTMVKALGFLIYGYADDHQILKTFSPKNQHICLTEDLNICFHRIYQWMSKYYLQLNASKTEIILFGPPDVLGHIPIHGCFLKQGITIRFVSTIKNLGFIMDSNLTLTNQIISLKKNCFATIRKIAKIRYLLSKDSLKTIVNSLVISCLDYCNALYYGIDQKLLLQLQQIQNAASKLVMGKYKHCHMDNDLNQLHWLPIKKRIIFKIALLVYKSVNGLAPPYLQELFGYIAHGNTIKLEVPYTKTRLGGRAFSVIGPRIFNSLPAFIRESPNVALFKKSLKTYLFMKHDIELNFDPKKSVILHV